MSDKILTIELGKENDTIEIFFNKSGYLFLKNMLDKMNTDLKTDHFHLMTENWGGGELTNEIMHKGNRLVNHAKIIFIDE